MSDESIKPLAPSNNNFAPMLNPISVRLQVKLDERFLKQDKITFTHKQVVNIYIMYKINLWPFSPKVSLKKSCFLMSWIDIYLSMVLKYANSKQ